MWVGCRSRMSWFGIKEAELLERKGKRQEQGGKHPGQPHPQRRKSTRCWADFKRPGGANGMAIQAQCETDNPVVPDVEPAGAPVYKHRGQYAGNQQAAQGERHRATQRSEERRVGKE